MNDTQKAELLAPCGNFDCVKAALNAGADAVYLGGKLFSARAFAGNFDLPELEQAVDLCHRFAVRVYVTVNILYKDTEFADLLSYIDQLYAIGVDGLIMQDTGAIRTVRQLWPDLPVHASTQLTVNSLADIRELEALGVRTAVLSRELNLKEIRQICQNTRMRIETFIHGALCVSYSGQCLMSSVLGSRSGNRGRCAQNCRLSYELRSGGQRLSEGHLLSTKDICTLPLLPELLQTGVASLKIEGRMKTPEYVAGVTSVYRKYLDMYYAGQPYQAAPEDVEILQQLFNRGAFSRGYLKTHSGLEMMCPTHPRAWGVPAGKVFSYDKNTRSALIRFRKDMVPGDGIEIRTDSEDGLGCYLNRAAEAGKTAAVRVEQPVRKDQEVYRTYDKRLMDELHSRIDPVRRRVPLTAKARIRADQPAELELSVPGFTVRVTGDTPVPAQNQALTADTVQQQIAKLGGSDYRLEHFSAEIADGLYLNRSALNALRSHAAECLTEAIIRSAKHTPAAPAETPPGSHPAAADKALTVSVRTREQFAAALDTPSVRVIYAEMNPALMEHAEDLITAAHSREKQLMIRLPRIWREYIQQHHEAELQRCLRSDADGFLISCLGHLHALRGSGKAFCLDFTGNVLNSRTVAFWQDQGAERVAVSPEMSREEINALADRSRIELLVCGRLPLMVTHQCPVGNFLGGKKDRMHCRLRGHTEAFYLQSGRNRFPLETDCRDCLCTVTTDAPVDLREALHSFDVAAFRLDFAHESGAETAAVLSAYEKILHSPAPGNGGDPGIYAQSAA